ncbi:MAG: DegT/DnrJ/EryC1/StrS family aminotransferase [Peptococcaceae bacterium]|nr:DegT/DnrJ/EryC1/StrS family aminotransferase [Peptococcaceae bacterium]
MVNPFKDPVFVTRPLLPPMHSVHKRLQQIWESKWLTNIGAQHQELEEQLGKYLQARHLALFNNGTLALLIGLKALGLTGEAITTPFTFPATVQALDWAWLRPVFCDIDPDTLNIDVQKIEGLITTETTAILGVHVFGSPCPAETIDALAAAYGLKVIYDGAHAFQSRYQGRPISAFGDMTMFSFHATKLFNTVEGGALVVKDGSLLPTINMLKNFGIAGSEEVVLSGINAKMNEVQAGIGLEVLKMVAGEREKRKEIKKTYIKNLAAVPGIRFINDDISDENSFQYLVIAIDQELFGWSRDAVHEELKNYNVFTRKYFYPLCSNFPWYRSLPSTAPELLPVANQLAEQVLSLPFYGGLGVAGAQTICEILRRLCRTTIGSNIL